MTGLELVQILLPAILVFGAAFWPVYLFLKNENQRRQQEVLLNNQKMFTPIRIQAYERMVLFLERISPQSIVLRSQQGDMTVADLQGALLKNIRIEFEHNMAHQLYISDKAWEKVKTAKETVVKKINQAAVTMKPDVPAINLSKRILESHIAIDKDPIQEAISFLKDEMRSIYTVSIK